MKRWVDETVRLSMIAKITVRNLSKTNGHQFSSVVERIRHPTIEKIDDIDYHHFLVNLQKLIILCTPKHANSMNNIFLMINDDSLKQFYRNSSTKSFDFCQKISVKKSRSSSLLVYEK
jgi:hypothetical protein